MQIYLIRHGQSLANTQAIDTRVEGDFHVRLSPEGVKQARALKDRVSSDFVQSSLIYTSPYQRARETLQLLLEGHGLVDAHGGAPRLYQDPLLREHDRGYYDEASQRQMREAHGWFYYRHLGGESPADVYLRASVFLESLYRERQRSDKENVLIVAHGMFIRCFVMRFLHLNHEDFLQMRDPDNTDIIRIIPRTQSRDPVFLSPNWCVEGLRLYSSL